MRGQDHQTDELFSYVSCDAPVPAEHPLHALLLQAFYSIRSERQLMEQMDYNLLFRRSGGERGPFWAPFPQPARASSAPLRSLRML